MTPAIRTYGGRTAQQRRDERRRALVDAALDLIAAGGADAVTVRGVCTRARLNDRYFTESFRDTDELLATVLTEVGDGGVRSVLAALDGVEPKPRPMVRTAVDAGLAFLESDPRYRAVLAESQATQGLRRARHDLVRMLAATVVGYGNEVLGADAPPEPDAQLAALTLVNGLLELLAGWVLGELDVTREHFADFLVAMILTMTDLSATLMRESSPPSPPRD